MNQRGSILLEGIALVSVSTLALILLLEILRSSILHMALEQAAFIYVRERAFGASQENAKNRAMHFVAECLGARFSHELSFKEFYRDGIHSGKVHIRYPQFARLKFKNLSKHHLEVTKTCQFHGG